MALVAGTNCGFCTTAPTGDPGVGNDGTFDGFLNGSKWTIPAGTWTITQLGWWLGTAGDAAAYQMAVYAHDAVNDCPEDVIGSITASGNTGAAGWQNRTGLSIAINTATHGTTLWIGIGIAAVTNDNRIGYDASGGTNVEKADTAGTLDSNWGAAGDSGSAMIAAYAKYEAGGGSSETRTPTIGAATLTGVAPRMDLGIRPLAAVRI